MNKVMVISNNYNGSTKGQVATFNFNHMDKNSHKDIIDYLKKLCWLDDNEDYEIGTYFDTIIEVFNKNKHYKDYENELELCYIFE